MVCEVEDLGQHWLRSNIGAVLEVNSFWPGAAIYVIVDFGQHWLKGAWWHQSTTFTSTDSVLIKFKSSGTYISEFSETTSLLIII